MCNLEQIKTTDIHTIVMNGYIENLSLWKEMLQLDLSDTLSKVNVPYIILQGDTDIVASTTTVKQLIADCSNSNLQCIEINNTGHYPTANGMEILLKELIELTSDSHAKRT